jgi:hypothetical protein
MHQPLATRRVPRHVIFLAAFAAIAAATAYALHAKPDAQRPAVIERATESTAVARMENAAATPAELTVAEQAQAPAVTPVAAPRHRSSARRHAHGTAWPSGAGGSRSLASLPPPGD